MPIAPGVVSDGNFRIAQQNGAVSFSYPFAESRDDFDTFIASRVMRVEDGYYQPPFKMSQRNFSLGQGYLVGVTPLTVVEGTNLVEYTETYANVPPRQVVYGSASATIQQIVNLADSGPARLYPLQISDTFDAQFVYEYAVGRTTLETIYRAKLVQYPFGITNSLLIGVNLTTPPPDGLYLIQNSTTTRWLGGIFCRETVFVQPPPISKWKPPTA